MAMCPECFHDKEFFASRCAHCNSRIEFSTQLWTSLWRQFCLWTLRSILLVIAIGVVFGLLGY